MLFSVLLFLVVLGLGLSASPTPAQTGRVRVIPNGEDVALAGDAIVQDGVVMAPIPGLFEPLGVRVTWDARTRVLTLQSPAGDEMELRADDPYATVNGERRPIPVPLVAVLGHVLVPAQWVFDSLGDVTRYDTAQRTLFVNAQIMAVSWRATDAGLEVSLEATAPLHPRIGVLHAPERLVVDVPGAVARTPHPLTDVNEGPLQTIRMGQSATGARIAARGGATVFISIHANAAVDAIADETSHAAGFGSRGIAVARFAVLVGSPHVPAVLVETALATNPREEQLLRDPAAQQTFAQDILKGVQRYVAAPAAAQP